MYHLDSGDFGQLFLNVTFWKNLFVLENSFDEDPIQMCKFENETFVRLLLFKSYDDYSLNFSRKEKYK